MTGKAELRRARHERFRPAREQKRRERRCFWTWPFGHILDGDGVCEHCGHVDVLWP